MSFEVVDKDLLGRIGRLRTHRRVIETPLFLPVVNPLLQTFSTRVLEREFDCKAIMANSYLLKKNFESRVKTLGIHDFLNFSGVVMTDSGAYQILVYGGVDATPLEIVEFQEDIGSDIAVILDVPTGWKVSRDKAEYTVDETLRRAHASLEAVSNGDVLWVGPIQGGEHLDLLAHSASRIGQMPFQICGLGSPTPVMERYLFKALANMTLTAKKNMPLEKPLHLFGAGHPFMFSLAVAMGCDMFDSAAYALYARQGKYVTEYRTIKLKHMEYFPCSCPVCSSFTPQELKAAPSRKRDELLAKHNLHACFTEIRRIKQAIREGRLWELLELRSKNHPSLHDAFKELGAHQVFFEANSPLTRKRGLFFFDSIGLYRPEILRHRIKLLKWQPPNESDVLVLLPKLSSKPFSDSLEVEKVLSIANDNSLEVNKVLFCVYASPFGVVPLDLSEVFPLSQYEATSSTDKSTEMYLVEVVKEYILNGSHGCGVVVLHSKADVAGGRLIRACEGACSRAGIGFISTQAEDEIWSKKNLNTLIQCVSNALKSINFKE